METNDREPVPDRPAGSTETDAIPPLRWPPPGLGRIHGDAYNAFRWLAAGAVLILPLLWAVVSEQDPWSLGPLGESVWLAFLLAVVGIPVLLGGYIVLTRLLRRAVQAVAQGVHWRVVALVATDHRRDTGFLLQGERSYRLLTDGTRRRLATVRIAVGFLYVLAMLWLSLGFGASVVAAARGWLSPEGVALVTLAPSAAAAVVATLLYAWEERLVRRIRKKWYARSWSQRLVREELRDWQAAMSTRAPGIPDPESVPEDGGRSRITLRASHVTVGVVAAVAFIPVFSLIFSAAIIPVVARISVPALDQPMARFASVEPLRSYVLAPDPSITAQEAGAMLHNLSFVGRPYHATEGVLPPERTYERPWFPASLTGQQPAQWVQGVVERLGEPIPVEQRPLLDTVAAHPAHAELSRLARAPAMDITGVRWSMPLPSDITMAELSMPSLGQVRRGAYAHLARAAVQAADGDVAAADTTIREVISLGLLMADESPTLLDNLVGVILTGTAGHALEALYRNTGHPEADALAWGLRSAAESVERARTAMVADATGRLRAMPQNALDSAMLRGLRWEYLGMLNTLGPCINLRRVVFGPGPEYDDWLGAMESSLVRYPAEAELFQVARSGLLGHPAEEQLSLPTRVLALSMGDASEPGSCARILGEIVGF